MDESPTPTAGGFRLSLAAAGEAWSWRLTTPEGGRLGGLAPDPSAARRSAAFAAAVAAALDRARSRRI